MRINDIINEVFQYNNKFPDNFMFVHRNYGIEYEFTTKNGNEYSVLFDTVDYTKDKYLQDTFRLMPKPNKEQVVYSKFGRELNFSMYKPALFGIGRELTTNLTGTGDELEVFRNVVKGALQFINEYNPTFLVMYIKADKSSNKRKSLYNKIADKAINMLPNWKKAVGMYRDNQYAIIIYNTQYIQPI